MRTNTVAQRMLFGTGILLLLLMLPLIIVIGMSGVLLGLIAAFGFLMIAGLSLIANRAQRIFRNRKADSVSQSTYRTRQIAKGLGVPLVDQIRPPDKPVEAIVRLTAGGCPLMREAGDVFRISEDGKLSSPLCSPSAAAVQRLVQNRGLESGSTAHCVCPLGDHELTFALDAA